MKRQLIKMRKLFILGLITLFTLVLFNSAEADPFPATTQVDKLRVAWTDLGWVTDQSNPGPQEYEQALYSDISGLGADGYAIANFGPGIPQIGIARTNAMLNNWGSAVFSANVLYSFEIQLIGSDPDPAISTIPVLFSARGEGSAEAGVESGARTAAIARVYGNNVTYDQGTFEFDIYLSENESVEANFDGMKYLDLYPSGNSHGVSTYGVQVSAVSETWGGCGCPPAPALQQKSIPSSVSTRRGLIKSWQAWVEIRLP